MMRYIVPLLLVAALLVACAPQETPQQTPTPTTPEPVAPAPTPDPVEQPPAEEVADPGTNDAEEAESGLDKVFGTVDENQVITVDDVYCNFEAKEVSFRFRNTDDQKSWQLNQNLPFPPPQNLGSVRVMINQYEANKRGGNYRNGELLFGPEEMFSENCGGVEVLAPGETATCTLTNVPLREGNTLGDNVNEVYIDSPGEGGRARFTC